MIPAYNSFVMAYYNFLKQEINACHPLHSINHLKGIFINSSYESNKLKCYEAYPDNFLFTEDMSVDNTMGRLKEMCNSFMLPIKEIERNPVGLCNIKCEDFDVKVEIENIGPFSFHLADDVYVLPPLPFESTDNENLKINLSNKTYLKPLVVPKHEIANIYDDMFNQLKMEECCYASLLYKTYKESIHHEMLKFMLSGYQFIPSGYIVAKSSHEPPNLNAVTIKPFERFIIVTSKPIHVPQFNIQQFFER